ncbi:MAG: hypothetical protein LJE91_18255 [Gammaproteobacteria bacterium]|nr:hypothetical protein [Gammaproteobacteria bacterium]
MLFHDEHADNNAIVLGISLDGREKRAEALEFIDRHLSESRNLWWPSTHVSPDGRSSGRRLS